MSNPDNRRPASLETVPSPGAEKPPSDNTRNDKGLPTLWSTYIWESLPTDNLKGPDPDPVSRAYQKNDWEPIFIDSRYKLNRKAAPLIARLLTLEDDAIDPRPFKLDELSRCLDKLDRCRSALRAVDPGFGTSEAEALFDVQQPVASAAPAVQPCDRTPRQQAANSAVVSKRYQECFQAAAEADIRLTADFFLFVKKMDPFSPMEEDLKALSGSIPLSTFFKELEPKTFNYEALRSAYAKYKRLAELETQEHVSMPPKVRPGDSGNYIRDLQKRLRQEDFYTGRITGVYDAHTQRAVKAFQTSHQLTPDGIVGRHTQGWLNVPFKEESDLIAYSLRAVRHSPSRAYNRFIRINIPHFMLEYYKDDKLQQALKVVVGKASGKKVELRGRMVGENQTPTMISSIKEIVLNPRWYVNGRIRLELDKEAKSNPEWFTEHGYVQMNSRYPWGGHRLFQSPGPQNALGRVKFEFPNPYTVYLHDTPQKYLFARSRRDFSHGCIRVNKAVELAETLLKDDHNRYADRVQSILKGTHQVFVHLSQAVPISVEYIPVVVGKGGHVIFAGDLYGVLNVADSRQR